MKTSTNKLHYPACILLIMLILYFTLMCVVNFLSPPSYYNSDMYSDIILAEKMWAEKTIFPNNWIFGNQLYVAATPVLSALFCGMVTDPYLAMGMASTVMVAAIFVSFIWMLKPALPSLEDRLYGLVYFVGIVLFFGDAAIKLRGWQLLFTMCSYYACYAITVFLAFGCCLRSKQRWGRSFYVILVSTCLLCFATGIQSLRQTMIMTVPLFAVELLNVINRTLQKKQPFTKSFFVSCAISTSNLAGVIVKNYINVSQREIFGSITFLHPAEIPSAIVESFSTIIDLFMSYSTKGMIASVFYLVLNVLLFAVLLVKFQKAKNHAAITILMLFAASVGCIWGIDIISGMSVRDIYYFMLYPFLAVLAMYAYAEAKNISKYLLLLALLCLSLLNIPRHVLPLTEDFVNRDDEIGYEISDYLEENNFTVAFGLWDFGDEIAVASKGSLKMQFWRDDATFSLFNSLRESEIYDDSIDKIVYVFYDEGVLEEGMEYAAALNAELTVLKQYPEENIYLCTASENLIQLHASQH